MKPQYLIQQPRKLQRLATLKVVDWIILEAKKLMCPKPPTKRFKKIVRFFTRESDSNLDEACLTHQIEAIRNAVEYYVPGMLHDILVIEVIKALSDLKQRTHLVLASKYLDSYERKVMLRISETLINQKLRNLVINYGTMIMIRGPLFSKISRISSLVRLELHFIQGYMGLTDETNLIEMLKLLPNLKYLTLQTICTDNILRCIVDNCQMVEVLDLIFSRNINDTSVQILKQFIDLKKVNLSDTTVSKLGIVDLLTSSTNIIEIVNRFSNTVAEAIEYIASNNENADIQLMLNSYSSSSLTTYEQLKLVVKMCRHIQKLEINKQMPCSLVILTNLIDLRELILRNFNFYSDHVKEVLEARGYNLEHLHLIEIEQLDISALVCISQMCPNLQSLIVTCKLADSRLQSRNKELKVVPFRNLRALDFHVQEPISEYADEEILFLLSNCPRIEVIRTSVSLNDDIMLKILDENPLMYLEKFIMLCSNLSKSIVDRIIQNCINHPVIMNYQTRFKLDRYEF